MSLLCMTDAKKVLLHNFAGRLSVAQTANSHGFYLSFPPAIVNKPDRDKLLKNVSLEHLCLETDSPALGLDKNVSNARIDQFVSSFRLNNIVCTKIIC